MKAATDIERAPDVVIRVAAAYIQPSRYPVELEADVATACGLIHIRPIKAIDSDGLVAFHEGLSAESQYLRFFSCHPHLQAVEVDRFTHVDYDRRLALVAERDNELIGIARYDRMGDSADAEVAFIVADECQGRGIGTLLLRHLATAASGRGIIRFIAETLPTNHRMQAVFRNSGFDVHMAFEDGLVRVTFPITVVAA